MGSLDEMLFEWKSGSLYVEMEGPALSLLRSALLLSPELKPIFGIPDGSQIVLIFILLCEEAPEYFGCATGSVGNTDCLWSPLHLSQFPLTPPDFSTRKFVDWISPITCKRPGIPPH